MNIARTLTTLALLISCLAPVTANAQKNTSGMQDLVVITSDTDRAGINLSGLTTGMEVTYVHSPERLDGSWLFGIDEPDTCSTALFLWSQIAEDNAEADKRVQKRDYAGAGNLFAINRGRMSCLSEPAISDELWKAYFLEGLSFAYQGEISRAVLAWELALVMEPNIEYPKRYTPQYKRMYEDAKGKVIDKGGKARVITAPNKASNDPGAVWIDGKPTTSVATEIYAGMHLIQVRGTDGKMRGFITKLRPGQVIAVFTPFDAVNVIRQVDPDDRLAISKWVRSRVPVQAKQVAFHDGEFELEVLESGNLLSQRIKQRTDARLRPAWQIGGGISYYGVIGWSPHPVHGANDQHNLGGVFWLHRQLGPPKSPAYLHIAFRIAGWDVRAWETQELTDRRLLLQPSIGAQFRLPFPIGPQFGIAAHFLPGGGQEDSAPLLVGPVASASFDIPLGKTSPMAVRVNFEGGAYFGDPYGPVSGIVSANVGFISLF